MFMIIPVVLSVLVALLLRRPLSRLADVRLCHPWLILIAILLQIVMFTEPLGPVLAHAHVIPVLNTATYVLVLVFCLLNFRVRSLLVVAVGCFLNGLAIIANGGYMPADPVSAGHVVHDLVESGIVNNSRALDESTRLPFLTDIFHMPSWMPLANVFSVGDIVVAIGVFLLLQELITTDCRRL